MSKDASYLMLEIWGRHSSERIPNGTRHSWASEFYVWQETTEDSSVRDELHAWEMLKALLLKDAAWHDSKPEKIDGEFEPWFTVALAVSDTRKKVSRYTIDYHKWKNCPLEVIDQGMTIYKQIKRNIKQAIKERKAKK